MITRLLPTLGRPARFLSGTPKRVGLLGVLVALFASVVGAVAYFTEAGSGIAAASVGSLADPSITTAAPGAGTVALNWSAVTAPSAGPVTYSVSRDGGNAGGDCPSSASPASATSCTDSGLSAGSHSFTVTAHWRSWTSTSGTTNVNLTLRRSDEARLHDEPTDRAGDAAHRNDHGSTPGLGEQPDHVRVDHRQSRNQLGRRRVP